MNKKRKYLLYTLRYIILIIGALAILFPIIWALSASFKSNQEVLQIPIQWIPKKLNLDNYITPFIERPFLIYFLNSVFAASVVTISNLLLSSLAGYGFSKFNIPGKKWLFLFVLSTLMVPIQVIIVPLFLIINYFGWVDSYQGLIVPLMVNAFGVFLMRQFMMGIPDDYLDAARIDGTSEIGIFFKIVLPLSTPVLAALGIFTFVSNWDEFLWPLIVINSDKLSTLPLGIAKFQGTYSSQYSQLLAMSLLAMLPLMIVFIFAQRRFIEGSSLSGLKQ
jgi:ABC-type sugar transport system, permease component